MWPGFGDNSRVLKWIFERCDGSQLAPAVDTPVGMVPDWKNGGLDLTGLDISGDVREGVVGVGAPGALRLTFVHGRRWRSSSAWTRRPGGRSWSGTRKSMARSATACRRGWRCSTRG